MIRIERYQDIDPADIFIRTGEENRVEAVVRDIIADVRSRGDEALLLYKLPCLQSYLFLCLLIRKSPEDVVIVPVNCLICHSLASTFFLIISNSPSFYN